MKQIKLRGLLSCFFIISAVCSCSQNDELFDAQGGTLPTNYILIKDGVFTPDAITVAAGSSFTFVNETNDEHSIVSDDSSAILSGIIRVNSSYYYKKDTVGVIRYHCGQHPSVSGAITFRP